MIHNIDEIFSEIIKARNSGIHIPILAYEPSIIDGQQVWNVQVENKWTHPPIDNEVIELSDILVFLANTSSSCDIQ